MSFIEEKLVTIQCDNCKDTYQDEDTGYGFWVDPGDAWEAANNDGWDSNFDRDNPIHYCPKCHDYNDDDELIIKTERKK